jgi:hypothetical protein
VSIHLRHENFKLSSQSYQEDLSLSLKGWGCGSSGRAPASKHQALSSNPKKKEKIGAGCS